MLTYLACAGASLLTLAGLLEQDVWVGDVLRFADCALRVVQPREPCFKFNAVMGYAQAAKDMVQSSRSGFYLAVDVAGLLRAGESFELLPGPRATSIAQALGHKARKHLS